MNEKQEAIKKVEELIPQYRLNKGEADDYKKLADKYNAEIKNIMIQYDLDSVSFDGSKVTCTKSLRQEFIEEALIAKLKALNIKDVIKKKEYVDMDALEDAIYKGELNAAELASCQNNKEVITLRLSSVKQS